MSEAHDELRKRLTAYRDAKALYESPDPYDREEARYEAMHLTLRRIGYDSELAQGLLDEHGALLDEVEQLRAMINEAGEGTFNVVALLDLYHTRATEADERAALAYPRALQAAANTAIDAIAGELDVDAERVADAILDLTEEQIDAFAVTSHEPEEGGTR